MILTDANLLLYAYNADALEHVRARGWLEEQLSASDLFCFAWQTITAFLRISTNQRAFPTPLSLKDATAIVTEWMDRPQTVILTPGENHWSIFERLLHSGQATGALVMDAHLATLAVEHGAVLASTDRDFARFPDLKFLNPLLNGSE
jgi:toxin-antitoxin system PIN domain toxin